MENKNEIKKLIYKEKPKARFEFIRMGVAYYYAELNSERINFQIPVDDMGTTDFGIEEEAKLLLRWIQL